MFEGQAVGGNSSQVVCIPLLLDMGDINVPVDSEYRKNLIIDMYTINGFNDNDVMESLEKAWEKYLSEIEKLKRYAALGEDIRLWYSDAPYSVCGLYFVCNILKEYDCRVFAVKLPHHVKISGNEIQSYTTWGEVAAGKFYMFLPLTEELSAFEVRLYASKWTELKEEKSTLRAVVNGKVIGVPEDFYDHIIQKEIPDGEFVMARLVGKILGKYPLGVGDWWYAKRINLMIEQGKLNVVNKNKETYSQTLKKVQPLYKKEI
jgi:hypothetical protein